jgi:ABC-2 type transport system permease protein
MKVNRIGALFLRQIYLYKRSLPRLMGILYWPVLDLVLWGFITIYLNQYRGSLPAFVSFFLGALILWDLLFRAQQGISISFLEDMWARNLLNVFVSPITVGEYLSALMLVSLIKIALTATVSVSLAWFLYSFNIFIIGVSLIPFVLNLLLLGWAVGIFTIALILRYGQQAEILAWGIAFLFQPVSAVFYPVSVLPYPMQVLALWVPSSHVFEGMRAVVSGGGFPFRELAWALSLNIFYLMCAVAFFYSVFRTVRVKGLLGKIGE